MAKKKSLKSMVDEHLTTMLEAKEEPSEGRMKLLAIAIKKLALDAKLEENEYGDFFSSDAHAGDAGDQAPARQKPVAGKRTNGGTDAA